MLVVSDGGGRPALSLVRLRTENDTPTLGATLNVGGDDVVAYVLRPDGREVYVASSDGIVKAFAVTYSGETAAIGAATPLFKLPPNVTEGTVTPDGQQVVLGESPFGTGQTLRVLTNWEARLKK